MMTGRVEGFFGLSASGAQYRYTAEYATALGHVLWAAQVFADDLLKGRPSGVVHGSITDTAGGGPDTDGGPDRRRSRARTASTAP